ncbi:hypothetical protein D3C85_1622790 [compost metagenome]
MAVHDHAVFAVRRLDALAMGEEVRRELRGRHRFVRQPPKNVVARAVAVHFYDA